MKVIVVGGVAAGMSAASKIRRMDRDAKIVVYEKGGYLSYGACGLPYYVGGLNDDPSRLIARAPEEFERMGIEAHTAHEVIRIDPANKLVRVRNLENGQEFVDGYDKLMIASGATAVMPPFEGKDLRGVHALKTMEDGLALKPAVASPSVQNIVIVGGGAIGMECADVFLNMGKSVRIIEAAPRILPPFDEEIADLLADEIEKRGAALHLGERVERFGGADSVRTVYTDGGAYPADLVIVAVGIRPATRFLEGSGIQTAGNGAIVVDRYMRTSAPDVYAAGDCALCYNLVSGQNEYQALGTVANKCGRLAGTNIAGGAEEFGGALGSGAIKVGRLEACRTGLGEQEAKDLGRDYKTVMVTDLNHPPYYPGATPVTVKLVYESDTKIILGAQLCGENGAVLRGTAFSAAIQGGMTTGQLGMLDFAYAPPFSNPWDVINIACNVAK